jgi:hypothetical protein
MNGALLPNSIEVFLTVAAHCSISNLPTSVEPVKVSLRTVGFEVSSPPISFDGPVTHENSSGLRARAQMLFDQLVDPRRRFGLGQVATAREHHERRVWHCTGEQLGI